LCRFGVEAASFAVEVHGGNGYCEDWGLTRQLRDAQCHPIWEGSENICVLDVMRAVRRESAHEAVLHRIDQCVSAASGAPPWLSEATAAVSAARDRLATSVKALPTFDADRVEAGAGRLTALLVETAAAALLLGQAAAGEDGRKGLVALRYARRHLGRLGVWDDSIAALAGRQILSYEPIGDPQASRAAA
jgi:hypothetical protein